MLFQSNSSQRGTREEAFILVPASLSGTLAQSVAGCIEGTYQCRARRVSAGLFEISYNKPFARKPVAIATALHASTNLVACITANTASLLTILVKTDAGVATDPTELHVVARGFDVAQQI